jgi:drug/metabolite transporter (DMT)-like permease
MPKIVILYLTDCEILNVKIIVLLLGHPVFLFVNNNEYTLYEILLVFFTTSLMQYIYLRNENRNGAVTTANENIMTKIIASISVNNTK